MRVLKGFLSLLFVLAVSSWVHAQERQIQNWLICGPFLNADLETECFPEEAVTAPKPGDYSGGKLWRNYSFVKEVYDLEEKPAFGYQDNAVGYAYAEINAKEDGWLQLQLGSDDGLKVWLNGKMVLINAAARAVNIAQDKVNLKILKGSNKLLLKINDLSGGWGFAAKVVGLEETDVENLEFNPPALMLERLPLKKVISSSIQAGDEAQFNTRFCVDEDMTTRWSSEHYEPQWYEMDFDGTVEISRVDLYWENAFAAEYKISVSEDGEIWEDAYTQLQGDGGHEIVILDPPRKAAAMRFFGSKKGSEWGMSFWEFEAYGRGPKGGKTFKESLNTVQAEVIKPYPVAKVNATSEQAPNPSKGEDFKPANAIDNNLKTRWGSAFLDPQSLTLDLGEVKKIHQIVLFWETACAKEYSVEISSDNANWETVFSTKDNQGGREVIYFSQPKAARYARMTGTVRKTTWGYSLWEFQVY